MRIFLHIGLEKTGTTAIQWSLWEARAELARQGVLYPERIGRSNHSNHMHLAIACAAWERTEDLRTFCRVPETAEDQPTFAQAVRRELAREVEKARPETLVLSNEHLSSRLLEPDEVSALHRLLAPLSEDIRVIVYLRRQDDLFLSYYSEQVKRKCPYRLEAFEDRPLWLDFRATLDRWGEVFGEENLIVRSYPPESGDILIEFCDIVGLRRVPPPTQMRRNQALDHLNAALLADLNHRVQADSKRAGTFVGSGLLAFMEARSAGPRIEIGRERRRELLSDYEEGNEAVRARFFPDRARLFPGEIPSAEVPAEPVYEDALDLILDIWTDRAALAQRLRALERGGIRGQFRRARTLARRLRDHWLHR